MEHKIGGRIWWTFLVAYLVLHLIVDLVKTGDLIRFEDTVIYTEVTRGVLVSGYPSADLVWKPTEMAEGQSFREGFFAHPPLFFYLGAPFVLLAGSRGLPILNTIVTTLSIEVVRRIGNEVAEERTGYLAAALWAMNPLVFLYGSTGMLDPLAFLLAAISLLIILRNGPWPLAGLLMGLSLLTRETAVVFLVPLAIMAYQTRRKDIISATGLGLAIGALFPLLALMISPGPFGEQFLYHGSRPYWSPLEIGAWIFNMAPFLALLFLLPARYWKDPRMMPWIGFLAVGLILFYLVLTRKFWGLTYPLVLPLSLLSAKGLDHAGTRWARWFVAVGGLTLLGFLLPSTEQFFGSIVLDRVWWLAFILAGSGLGLLYHLRPRQVHKSPGEE